MVRDRDCKFLFWRIFDETVEIFSVEGTDRENEFFHIFAVDFVCEKWEIVEMSCWKDLGRISKICLGWVNVKTKMWEAPGGSTICTPLNCKFWRIRYTIRVTFAIRPFPL